MNKALLAASLLIATALPAFAQEVPGTADTTKVKAGSYTVDSNHTQVAFTVNHMGFSLLHGLIGGSTGKLTLDPKAPEKSTLEIEIPMSGIVTTSSELTSHLQTADFFDAAKFPTATFKSSKIQMDGDEAVITGDLTLHGVTKEVTLEADFTGAGTNPMSKAETVGFSGETTIKRSDFGISKFVPVVSDEVELDLTAAFELAK
jgi:polyisoprenoid-binding protein YceI